MISLDSTSNHEFATLKSLKKGILHYFHSPASFVAMEERFEVTMVAVGLVYVDEKAAAIGYL